MNSFHIEELGRHTVNFTVVLAQLERGRRGAESGEVYECNWDYLAINRGATQTALYLQAQRITTLQAVADLLNHPNSDIQNILMGNVEPEKEREAILPALAYQISDAIAGDLVSENSPKKFDFAKEIKSLFFK